MKHTNHVITKAIENQTEHLARIDLEISETEKTLCALNQGRKQCRLIIEDLEESLLTLNNKI